MQTADVRYGFVYWWYFGHAEAGLYCVMSGGIVLSVWVPTCWSRGSCLDDHYGRLIERMVVVLVSSLVAIMAQCIALRIVLWLVGWANMIPELEWFQKVAGGGVVTCAAF